VNIEYKIANIEYWNWPNAINYWLSITCIWIL